MFALDMDKKWHTVSSAQPMYWFKLIFLVLWLTGALREGDACGSQGDERSSHFTAAAYVTEDAGAPKNDPSPSARYRLTQPLVKRKPDASLLPSAALDVPPVVNSRSSGCLFRSYTATEDDLTALYRFLRVYRC